MEVFQGQEKNSSNQAASTSSGGKTTIPPGRPLSSSSQTLNTMAGLVQEFEPLKNICGFLNAFHLYADEPKRFVEANHYCAALNEGEYLTWTVDLHLSGDIDLIPLLSSHRFSTMLDL